MLVQVCCSATLVMQSEIRPFGCRTKSDKILVFDQKSHRHMSTGSVDESRLVEIAHQALVVLRESQAVSLVVPVR
jgi:hypothetical protein